MYNVYKVTAATIKKTRSGCAIYSLHLNKSIWATKLVPLSDRDRRYDKLYQQYLKNNNSLEFLLGRYIAVRLEETQFGKNFKEIISFNVLEEFKKLLDESKGRAFFTSINVFEFLKGMGYPINRDESITLKEPYATFDIIIQDEITVCYPNKKEEGTLTLDNLRLIYENFYKDKYIDNGNPDCDEQYAMTPVAIVKNRRIFHKSKSQELSSDSFDVLMVGDNLSDEERQFLSSVKPIEL